MKRIITSTIIALLGLGSIFSSYAMAIDITDGVKKDYYINGNLKLYQTYKDGKLNGITKIYSEDGTIMSDVMYKDGNINGKARFYDKKGNVASTNYYVNGKSIKLIDQEQKQEKPVGKTYVPSDENEYFQESLDPALNNFQELDNEFQEQDEDENVLDIDENSRVIIIAPEDSDQEGIEEAAVEEQLSEHEKEMQRYKKPEYGPYNGIYREYYDNGTIRIEEEYFDDKLLNRKEFDFEGNVFLETIFP